MSIRNGIVLLVLGLYLVLNWGFMLVRGFGVPVGEILLLFFFLTFITDIKWMPHFSRSIFLLPFLLWWALGIGRALAAVPEFGLWALRDATHVIESLFLWVGFVFAANPRVIDRFFVWLRRILAIGCVYAFTFPFRDVLREISPTIQAAAGYTTTIFFHYSSTYILLVMQAAYRVIMRTSGSGIGSLLAAGFLVVYAMAIFQARTVYLQVIALLILFAWQRRAAFAKMGMALVVAGLAFLILTVSGVEIIGRLGQPASADFLFRHFAAIWGTESEGVVGAARGVGQRIGWAAIIWRQVTDNVGNFFFGLGYGLPLIDFVGRDSQIVREPHNSYISILGRMGLFGIIVFTWGHLLLVRAWFRAFSLCRRAGYRLGQDRLLLFMVYFVLVWINTLGEDALEKPFIAIPYYFFWGIVLHYGQHLRHAFARVGFRAYEPPHWLGEHAHARSPGP